ncbi:SDR family NAD(P)-dependent oxidoreductase, partial [Nocardia cyriacigeorgica]|uniref:SDR family NAD(P)-dependent oxidoreductase n=1 Tax=Nocardia cyriacigeorgica TaxID=135487 RepID=UPI002458AD92
MTRTRILITGASAGLGAGMARQFAAKGRDLALCARRLDALEALRDELTAAHPDITVAVRALDVDEHAAIPGVFGELRDELGGLDRVIVNAGIGKGAKIGTGRADANLATATTDFVSALAQAEAALEIVREQNSGHLVLVSSMSAVRGFPGKGGGGAAGAGAAGGGRARGGAPPGRPAPPGPGRAYRGIRGRRSSTRPAPGDRSSVRGRSPALPRPGP